MLEQLSKCKKVWKENIFARKSPRKEICLLRRNTSISYLEEKKMALPRNISHHTASKGDSCLLSGLGNAQGGSSWGLLGTIVYGHPYLPLPTANSITFLSKQWTYTEAVYVREETKLLVGQHILLGNPSIGLAKQSIWVFPYDLMEKSERFGQPNTWNVSEK